MTEMQLEKIRSFNVLLLDADGVWFDGYESRALLPDGNMVILKRRHYHDGQGLSFLRSCGIRIKFVTGEGEPLQSIVSKLNDLPSVRDGSWAPVELSFGKIAKGDKISVIEDWLKENNYLLSDCVYIGDDINDYAPMKKISESGGLAVAPFNGTRKIKSIANFILSKEGGCGAVREFAEIVLDARGIDEASLSPA